MKKLLSLSMLTTALLLFMVSCDNSISGNPLAKDPDINVLQGTTTIANGSGPFNLGSSIADGNNGEAATDVMFTIENSGNADLNITSVAITAGDIADFDLVYNGSGVISPSGTEPFTVRFDPLTSGNKSATVSIESNDPDESSYTFTINGTADQIVEVVFAVDASGSVGLANWNHETAFMSEMIRNVLPAENKIGLVVFATQTSKEWGLNDSQDRADILNKVDNLVYTQGWTHHRDALDCAVGAFKESTNIDTRRIIILITDGVSAPKEQDPSLDTPEAIKTRQDLTDLSVETFIVGIGSNVSQNTFSLLMADPAKQYIGVATFDQLPQYTTTLGENIFGVK